MKIYIIILKTQFLSLWQYRMTAISSIFIQIFWGFLLTMIFKAFYSKAAVVQPMSISQTITFIWIGQALLQLLPWNVDKQIEQQIHDGNIAYELIRPIKLYWFWFFKSLATKILPTLMKSIPLFLISNLFFDLSAPVSWIATFVFFISFLLSLLLSSAISTIITITLFWTISAKGLQSILPPISMFFSGMATPLLLFPKWLQPFLSLQPLRGLIDIPCRLYTGLIHIHESIYFLIFQLFWTLIFIILGKILIHKALKRIIIQGG